MLQMLRTDRRSCRDTALRNLSLLLLPLLVSGQISVAVAGVDSQVRSLRRSTAIGSQVEELPQPGTWDALTRCIKNSKERRALDRWLFCVEAVESEGTSGTPLYSDDCEVFKPNNEVSSAYDHLSTVENMEGQDGSWRGRMALKKPNVQLGSTELQLQKVQGRQDCSEDGGLGLFKVSDSCPSEGMSSLDSADKGATDSRRVDAVTLVEGNSHGGFVSGPIDASPSPVNDEARDSQGNSQQDFLSYRADKSREFASDSSDEVDQVLAKLENRGRRDDSQQGAEKDIRAANSVAAEALNPSSSGFLSSQDGLIAEEEHVSSIPEENLRSSLGMTDAITSSAIVGLLTMLLRAQRGRGVRKSEILPVMSTGSSELVVESNALQTERKFHIEPEELPQPIGMAVAQVFYEVLEQNGDYSEGSLAPESLANLLGSALKESLMPVLGNDRFHFVEKFTNSFGSTYRTRATVRSAYREAGMRQTEARLVSGKSWRESHSKLRRESKMEEYPDIVEGQSDDQEVNKRSEKLGAAYKTKRNSVKEEEKGLDTSFKEGNHIFSTGKHGRSDSGGSSTGYCLCGSSLSGTSQVGFPYQDNNTPVAEENCSEDEQMYSADDSSDNEEWIVLEHRGSVSEAEGRKENSEDDGPSSRRSLECVHNVKGEGFTTCDPVDKSQNPQSSSCSAGDVCSSMDTHTRGESSGSQGIATPRSELSANSLEVENYLHFTRSKGLTDDAEPSRRRLIADRLLQSGTPRKESHTMSEDSRGSSLQNPERNLSVQVRRGKGEGLVRRLVSADTGGNENQMTAPRARSDVTQSSDVSVQDALVLASSSNVIGFSAALDERFDLFERSVAAQEQHNRLLAWDLQRRSQGLAIKEEHLHLQFESNTLMKENVELSRIKADFKENELQDRKLTLAYNEFSRTCADQLVAGLCVMLVVLGFSFWKFSYDRLSGIITVCQPPVRETHHQGGWLGTNWMYNSLNSFTYQMQAFTCEVTKAGRMVVGLVIIAFVTSTLLRRSVTSSSQAMPATIIVIVLGGICGIAGKFSVDSLGGSGFQWVVLWESLCFLHAFATCFTAQLYHLLNGPPPRNYFEKGSLASRISSGIARLIFHAVLVIILPFMAGVLPFASLEEVMQIFLDWWSPGSFHGKYRVPVRT